MRYMSINELRETFLTFFEQKGHLRAKSFSLIPENDNSLLLINSGMAPMKPYFTGLSVPPNKRMTTCQKCIRTGDIDNVGKTDRHGTFFEMLGNFSFGDYFKEEIIPWSWEFLTKVIEIPEDRLFVSVYEEDTEAAEIWHKKVGLDKSKIFPMGKDDNFWEVGIGPCGPCSEIYYDRGPKYGCGKEGCTVGCDCDRYMEVWNLVFTQFNKEEDGSYEKLAHPNIDTGMGLERLGVVTQDVDSIFDTDAVKALRDEVCRIAKIEYRKNPSADVSIRVITDHIRSVTFLMADGVTASNEGRGYVLKRLLRRAARHGKLLGINEEFLSELSAVVIRESKDAYPELAEKQSYITKLIAIEESRFYETLDQGIEMLKNHMLKMRRDARKVMLGKDAFKLYDTYGFPLELMKEILEEESLDIDEEEFKKEMEHQRETSRTDRGKSTYMGAEDTIYNSLDPESFTEFCGYDKLEVNGAAVTAIILNDQLVESAPKGASVSVILDKTSFYAEGGGQAGDQGIIKGPKGVIKVADCIKVGGNKYAHIGIITEGGIYKGDQVTSQVEKKSRSQTARNHTATHLLQKALRQVLGDHVEQAGSDVTQERLRFDFTHFEAMTEGEIKKVEDLVNDAIFEAMPVNIFNTDMAEARQLGATALFGEKYGDSVRVVDISGYSIELCGGTHVANTAQIGVFKLLSEASAAAGVRRIEAITGYGALEYFNARDQIIASLGAVFKTSSDRILKRAESFIEQTKELKAEISKLKSNLSGNVVDDLIKDCYDIKGEKVVIARIDGLDGTAMRTIGDQVKDRLLSGVIILCGAHEDKVGLVVMVSDDLVKKGVHAGNIIKEIAGIVGGRGGGKPNMAQAGGKDAAKIPQAVTFAKELMEQLL